MADATVAKAQIRLLFEMMGITRVVVVDDVFASPSDTESIIGQVRAFLNSGKRESLVGVPLLTNVFSTEQPDDEVLVQRVREVVDDCAPAAKISLAVRLNDLLNQDHGEDVARSELVELFSDFEVILLSPAEWKSRKTGLLENESRTKTLFLFDHDLAHAEGQPTQGMEIIAGLMRDPNTRDIYCGLLTHTVKKEEEAEAWRSLAASNGIDEQKDRFAVISKAHLGTDPTAFSFRIKRVALTGKCNELKQKAASVLNNAHEKAARALNELSVFDFEQIVFQSSFLEGVWEPDTLFRLFGLFQRREAMSLAKLDGQLGSLADKIRQVIDIPYAPEENAQSRSWRIQRLENYEDSQLLNGHFLPLELGDVFQRATGGSKQFVLLGPPCDLMVRSDGKRAGTKEGILAEITPKKPKRPENFFRLPHFNSETGEECWVRFRETATIPLCILDLCAVRDDGSSNLGLTDTPPVSLIPAWQTRFRVLQSEVAAILERYKSASKGLVPQKSAEAQSILVNNLTACVPGIATGSIDTQNQRIAYGIKRVGRITGTLATAMLKAYALYLSRDAFAHDITTELHNNEAEQGAVAQL